MKLWNLTARACVSALVVAGIAAVSGCNSGGLESYGRAPLGWVAPEGDDSGWKKPTPAPAPKPAPAMAVKPAQAPAPAPAPGNCMYIPTGDKGTSSLSLCCKMPASVIAGQNFTYEVEICNLTNMDLNNVVVVYTLDGARIVSSEPPITGTGFAVGDLGPKACRSVKVVANAATVGSVKGCTSATWTNAMCCATNVVSPALKIAKSVTPDNGTPCDTFTYRVVVTNTGTGAATNVKVTDNLPAGVTSDGKSALTFDAGSLAAGQSREFSFPAKAAKIGSYSNDATATADNNLSAKSNAVNITVKAPQLAITKQCPANLRLGRPATFKIVVSNKGDAPAANTRVEDTLPAGATFVSATDGGTASGGKVSWNIGTLAPGASKEVGLTLNVTAGKINNVAMASATCAESVSANCGFDVQGVPDIGTYITDDDGVVLVGNTHNFRYEVKNQGQIDLTNVTVVFDLDDGLAYQSTNAPSGGQAAGQKLTVRVGTVKAGQVVDFNIVAKGTKQGQFIIRSVTTSDQTKEVRNDEQVNYVD